MTAPSLAQQLADKLAAIEVGHITFDDRVDGVRHERLTFVMVDVADRDQAVRILRSLAAPPSEPRWTQPLDMGPDGPAAHLDEAAPPSDGLVAEIDAYLTGDEVNTRSYAIKLLQRASDRIVALSEPGKVGALANFVFRFAEEKCGRSPVAGHPPSTDIRNAFAALERQLAAAQADARRYRWLREQAGSDEGNPKFRLLRAYRLGGLDRAIDAAQAQEPSK
jgi:hypothetical protein